MCDLVAIVAVPQPKVSRHLAYLRKAKLVVASKEGLWNYYQLSAANGAFHQALLQCLESCLHEMPELTADLARLQKNGSSCC